MAGDSVYDCHLSPDRRQMAKENSVSSDFSVFIAICHQSGDKWQSKSLILVIFDPRSPIVLMFSLDAYMYLISNVDLQ